MADPPAPPAVTPIDSNSIKPESITPTLPDPTSDSTTPPPAQPIQSALNPTVNSASTLNPNPALVSPLPPGIPAYGPPAISGSTVLPAAPSFRPIPQFATLPGYQNPSVGVQPPGVSAPAAVVSGAPGAVPLPGQNPMMPYQVPPGQNPNPALRQYAPLPNGFAAIPGTVPPTVS